MNFRYRFERRKSLQPLFQKSRKKWRNDHFLARWSSFFANSRSRFFAYSRGGLFANCGSSLLASGRCYSFANCGSSLFTHSRSRLFTHSWGSLLTNSGGNLFTSLNRLARIARTNHWAAKEETEKTTLCESMRTCKNNQRGNQRR